MTALAGHMAMLALGAGLTPPVTSGMVLWLDASQLSYADGASLTSWPDLSGTATPVTISGTVANRPVYRATGINGKPGVETDGGKTATAVIALSGAVGGTLMAVQKSAVTSVPTVNHGFNPSSGLDSWIPYTDSMLYDNNIASTRATIALPGGQNQTTPYLYATRASNTNRRVWYKGSALVSDSATYRAPGSSQVIGASNITSQPNHLVIAELAYFNRALSDAEITSMQAYFYSKWSLS